MQSIKLSQEFRTTMTQAEVDAVLEEVLVIHGHATRLSDEDGWTTFRSGSRFWFRVWGVWGPTALRRLPSILRTKTSSIVGGVVLVLELTSNEGIYLVRLPVAASAYRRAFFEIAEKLEAALLQR